MIFEYECDPSRFVEKFVARGSDSMREFAERLYASSFTLTEFDEYADMIWEGECSESTFYDWLRWDADRIFKGLEALYNRKEKNDGKVEEEAGEAGGDGTGSGATES